MLKGENTYRFFISAATPSGLVSFMHELTNGKKYPQVCLLKGGAGSGKSTLIKKAATLVNCTSAELLYCSLDPESLDAAVFDDKISIVDATPPHSIEPHLSGAVHNVLSLYDFFDNKKLSQNKAEIMRLYTAEKELSARKNALIRAAGMLLSSNESLISRCVNLDKLSNFITRLALREIKHSKEGKGEVKNRFLSAVTEKGLYTFVDTAEKLCEKIYLIDDDNGAVSGVICEGLLKLAVSEGYSVYACRCPMSLTKRIDHLLIPELSLGFMTSNKFHPIKTAAYKTIHTTRFLEKEKISEFSFRATFQKKAARELLSEAAKYCGLIINKHKELEKFYVDACDFKARDSYFEKTFSGIIFE